MKRSIKLLGAGVTFLLIFSAFVSVCNARVRIVTGGGIEDDDVQMSFEDFDDWLLEKYGVDREHIKDLSPDMLKSLDEDLKEMARQLQLPPPWERE